MDKYLVHNLEGHQGPATHAVVIGVGTYPHLPGGTDNHKTALHGGMRQLTSPPVSAREFAKWLMSSFHHPVKPLASVALLISEETSDKFKNPRTGQEFTPEYPSMSNTKQALRDWKARGDAHPDNQLLFYFCGHGISKGSDTALLLADYGAVEQNVFEDAIDFKAFQEQMNKCLAKHKIYFVDACRVGSGTIMEELNYAGQPIFQLPGLPQVISYSPIFYSTVAGAKAYGVKHSPSYFTQTLLNALNGEGAHNQNDDWRISTTRLKEAIDLFMSRAARAGIQRVQVSPTDGLVTFDFHYMKNAPNITVLVQCNNEDAQKKALLCCQPCTQNGRETKKTRSKASKKPWEVALEADNTYRFIAEFKNQSYPDCSREKAIMPPAPIVNLNVTP